MGIGPPGATRHEFSVRPSAVAHVDQETPSMITERSTAAVRPAESTFPEQLLGRIGMIHSTVSAAHSELRMMSARNHGPSPEANPLGAEDESKPFGRFHEVALALDALEAEANSLYQVAARLNETH